MNLNNIDLNKIRVFHSVVKAGSYQAAGEEIGLTRSAISQAMTTLESQLGVPLFQRKGRKLFPTNEAKNLSREFEKYQSSLNQVLNQVRGEENRVEGLIRIGSYPEFAKAQLPKLIKKFSDLHPFADFRFTFNSPSRLQSQLEAGRIDLSFSIFPHEGSAEIQSKKVFEQEMVLVAPKKMASKAKTLDGLLSLPLIEYYQSHQVLPRWISKNYGKRIRRVEPKVYAASAEMLLELVAQEMGVGVLPNYVFEESSHKNLVVVRPGNKAVKDHIWLNQFAGQFENSAHKAFYEFVMAEF